MKHGIKETLNVIITNQSLITVCILIQVKLLNKKDETVNFHLNNIRPSSILPTVFEGFERLIFSKMLNSNCITTNIVLLNFNHE